MCVRVSEKNPNVFVVLWPKTLLFLAYYTSYIMYVICECASEILDFKNRIILIGSLYSKRFFLFSFDHKIKQGIVRMRDVPFLFSLNVPLNTTHTHKFTLPLPLTRIYYTNGFKAYFISISIPPIDPLAAESFWNKYISCNNYLCDLSSPSIKSCSHGVSACEPLEKFTLLCVIEFW